MWPGAPQLPLLLAAGSIHPPDKLRRADAQRRAEPEDYIEGGVFHITFKHRNIRAVHAGLLCQHFLREARFQPGLPDLCANLHKPFIGKSRHLDDSIQRAEENALDFCRR